MDGGGWWPTWQGSVPAVPAWSIADHNQVDSRMEAPKLCKLWNEHTDMQDNFRATSDLVETLNALKRNDAWLTHHLKPVAAPTSRTTKTKVNRKKIKARTARF